jgi:citrate synthase
MSNKLPKKASAPENDPYVAREEALEMLGVKPATLYTYVSRGFIRSVRKPGGGKQSLYARSDIEKVKTRSTARIGHGVAAAGAMRWGEPIIPTAITEITAQGPRYRGQYAVALARAGAGYEAVAELLWTGLWFDDAIHWQVLPVPSEICELATHLSRLDHKAHMIEIFTLFTTHLGMRRGTTAGRMQSTSPLDAARHLIQVMAGCIGFIGPKKAFDAMQDGESIAGCLVRNFGLKASKENLHAIDSILILLADHELTSSTFSARVASSSGALLHGCVTAALATNGGIEIGRLYDRVDAFLQVKRGESLIDKARLIQEQGGTPLGFNHPLYPRGDPRADYLLEVARMHSRKNTSVEKLFVFLDSARHEMHLYPRVEMGVAAIALALRLPPGAGCAIFTIARTAGWIAHMLEQRTAGFMLRPRAKFLSAPG